MSRMKTCRVCHEPVSWGSMCPPCADAEVDAECKAQGIDPTTMPADRIAKIDALIAAGSRRNALQAAS